MRIAVAGGTGCVGSLVVDAVKAAGHEPVVIARSRGVDIISGRGLREALTDSSAVIDTCNVRTARNKKATRFFERATTSLLTVGKDAGVQHHVALSIVGIERVPLGYY